MHSKLKGNIGQTAVCHKFAEYGFSTFIEFGDISKVDLIAEKNGKICRIQCKCITPKNGALYLPLKKSGPNYKFKYQKEHFDYFAVVNLETSEVYLVNSSILDKLDNIFILRLEEAKNNQKTKINLADSYSADKVIPLIEKELSCSTKSSVQMEK